MGRKHTIHDAQLNAVDMQRRNGGSLISPEYPASLVGSQDLNTGPSRPSPGLSIAFRCLTELVLETTTRTYSCWQRIKEDQEQT